MRAARSITWALVALLGAACGLGACGLGAAEGGGSKNLPTAGLGPYGKLDAPIVVSDLVADLSDPAALPFSLGGFRIWYSRAPQRDDGTLPGIYLSDLPDLDQAPSGDPLPVLFADQEWEQGVVRAPAVVFVGGERLVLYYEGGVDPASIGWAISDDGGVSFVKRGLLIPGATDPGAVLGPDGIVRLYFTRTDASGIFVALSSIVAPDELTLIPDPVLDRRDTEAGVFDRIWIGEPAAAGGVTQVGGSWFALFYTGLDEQGRLAIGAAASHDGIAFERAGGGEPILEPGMRDETGPAPILFPAQGVLFFTQRMTQVLAIAVATSP